MENLGRGSFSFPAYRESEDKYMFTISNILEDINRGCATHNMVEDCFSYRIIFLEMFALSRDNKNTAV